MNNLAPMRSSLRERLYQQFLPLTRRSVSQSLGQVLILTLFLVVLTGCFQSAGDGLTPTIVDLTALASASAPTDTPFVTPLPPQGFTPNLSANTPTPPNVLATDIPATIALSTDASATLPADLPTMIPATPSQATPVPTSDVSLTNPALTTPDATSSTTNPAPTDAQAVNVSDGGLPTATGRATDGPCVHTVQPNEWLYKIAQEYKIDAAQLIAANPNAVGRILQPGDVINIPNCNKADTAVPASVATSAVTITPTAINPVAITPGFTPTTDTTLPTPIPLANHTYTVASGDTLDGIAHKFNIPVQSIKDANQLTSDFLSIGQQLKIPSTIQ